MYDKSRKSEKKDIVCRRRRTSLPSCATSAFAAAVTIAAPWVLEHRPSTMLDDGRSGGATAAALVRTALLLLHSVLKAENRCRAGCCN